MRNGANRAGKNGHTRLESMGDRSRIEAPECRSCALGEHGVGNHEVISLLLLAG